MDVFSITVATTPSVDVRSQNAVENRNFFCGPSFCGRRKGATPVYVASVRAIGTWEAGATPDTESTGLPGGLTGRP